MLLKRLQKLQVHQFRFCVSYISRSLQEKWKRRFIENDVENPFGSVKELAKYARKNSSKVSALFFSCNDILCCILLILLINFS